MTDERLTKEEKKLITELRRLEWGHGVVVVKGGKPVMFQAAQKDVKLTD